MQQNNIKRGALFMLLSVSLFAFMDLSVKALSAEYPIGEIIFFRGLGGLVTLFYFFFQKKDGLIGFIQKNLVYILQELLAALLLYF